jgi:hypothetical protein
MMFTSLEKLAIFLRTFAAERNWERFHSPKNLAMALSVEAARRKVGLNAKKYLAGQCWDRADRPAEPQL